MQLAGAVSIFDMDRTITRTGTYTPWLVFWAQREEPWRLMLLPIAALAALGYVLGVVKRDRLKEMCQSLLMGDNVPKARVEAVAAAYAEHVAKRNVLGEALQRVAAERAEGRRIVLATASYGFYAEAIAARLGITDVVATRSVWDGERLRSRIEGENCYGAAKLRMVEAWLTQHGLTDAPIRFFSDHISDLPVFERAAERIATTPSSALRHLATARRWEILDWS